MSQYRAIAEYYDPENAEVEWLQKDVPFLLSIMPKRPQRILEVACGTGRAAIPLAQAGHRVTAFDYDPAMLAIARRKQAQLGKSLRHLRLVRADATRFRFGERFDWAAIFFNTFLNFTTRKQQDQVLSNIRRHLKPSGHLWLDVFQPNLEILSRPRTRNVSPFSFFVPSLNRSVSMTTDVDVLPSKQLQTVTFRYRWFDERGKLHRETTRFQLTFIFPREMEHLLDRNGFRLVKMYGDYDGSELNDDSPRMICHARLK